MKHIKEQIKTQYLHLGEVKARKWTVSGDGIKSAPDYTQQSMPPSLSAHKQGKNPSDKCMNVHWAHIVRPGLAGPSQPIRGQHRQPNYLLNQAGAGSLANGGAAGWLWLLLQALMLAMASQHRPAGGPKPAKPSHWDPASHGSIFVWRAWGVQLHTPGSPHKNTTMTPLIHDNKTILMPTILLWYFPRNVDKYEGE